MYVKHLEGGKFATNNSDMSMDINAFDDAGYFLERHEIVVDIDSLDESVIKSLIDVFKIKTKMVWTDRGVHLYFRKPENSVFRNKNFVCALGFPIELKYSTSKFRQAVVVSRNGVLREVENEGMLADLPDIFRISNRFENLSLLSNGDGRNNSLFKHKGLLKAFDDKKVDLILKFINEHIFYEPLPQSEFEVVTRNSGTDSVSLTDVAIAESIINKYKVVSYDCMLHIKKDGKYTNDIDMRKIISEECSFVTVNKAAFIKKVEELIKIDAPVYTFNELFDVRFKNGVLRDGKVIMVETEDFTPYFIDIEYDENVEPVQIVDDYLNHISGGDEDFKKYILEMMAHTLLTNYDLKGGICKFFVIVGSGSNGKGTFLKILRSILGANNVSTINAEDLKDDRYQVGLSGKLANLGDDLPNKSLSAETISFLKKCTSCDYVTGRFLFKEVFSTVFPATHIYTSNHIIKTLHKDDGYDRRVVQIPMNIPVDKNKRDPLFLSKVTSDDALKYWFKLIVDAYLRIYDQSGMSDCKIIEEFTNEYHLENNSALKFLKDIESDKIERKILSEFYREYVDWCEISESIKPLSKSTFDKTIEKETNYEKRRTRISNDKNVWAWRLKKDFKEDVQLNDFSKEI